MYGPSIPPEFSHLWDPETGRWKDGALTAMLEILAPKLSAGLRVKEKAKNSTPEREIGEEG